MYTPNRKIGLHLYGRNYAWQTRCKNSLKKDKDDRESKPKVQFEFPGWKQISDKRSGPCYKSVWSLIIFVSFLLCGYQIADRIALFASNPISTEIVVQKNDSVKFPSFIVCPNFYTLQKIVPFQQQLAKEKKISFCDITVGEVMEKFNFSAQKFWSYVEVKSLLMDPTLFTWVLDADTQNSTSLLVTDLPMAYGTCRNISIPQLIPFRKEAFSVIIGSKRDYINCKHYPYAFNVYVRRDDDHVKYRPLSDSIQVQHYFSTTYGITAKQFVYLNTDRNPCSDYATVQSCQDKCYKKYSLMHMTCKLSTFDFESKLPACTTFEQYNYNTRHLAFTPSMIDYRKNCNCPRLCEETVYKTDFKSVRFEAFCEVVFYFEDNQIDLLREYYSYTVIPLLCDLGGNLGLFLGLCIPTVLENIENLVLYFKQKMF